MSDFIHIQGARVNNLKNLDVKIPLNKLTCIGGKSGSGKTSLAFHTLYAESRRRFLNSFPNYLKFFSDRPAPVDVDSISPVLPVFALSQTNPIQGTRVIVSDIMQLTDILQATFYNLGKSFCPNHQVELESEKLFDVIRSQVNLSEFSEKVHVFIDKYDFLKHFSSSPFPSRSFGKKINVFNQDDMYWEVLRFNLKTLEKSTREIQRLVDKKISIYFLKEKDLEPSLLQFSDKTKCPKCDEFGDAFIPAQYFSPYNALGACEVCKGFGANLVFDETKLFDLSLSVAEGSLKILDYKNFNPYLKFLKKEMKSLSISTSTPLKKLNKNFWNLLYKGGGSWPGLDELFKWLETKKYKTSVRVFIRSKQKEVTCLACNGSRLNSKVSRVQLQESSLSYHKIFDLNISELKSFISSIKLQRKEFKKSLLKINKTLDIAIGVGLGHLSLKRKAKTLSAGEYQRLLLLKYLAYEGVGALFVFDEPSLGLSINEKSKLLISLRELIKQGNTVIVIDHCEYFQSNADFYLEMGPGAGKYGGDIIQSGKYKVNKSSKLLFKAPKKNSIDKFIEVKGPSIYSSKYKDFKIRLNALTLVQGDSGSGKSSCIVNILANHLYHQVHGEYLNIDLGSIKKLKTPNNFKFDDIIVIDSKINRFTSRSTFGSLTELFTIVRKHFLALPLAKSMGLKDGHFSYNSTLGQCLKCEGRGYNTVEMQFLDDIILECEDCKGKKLKPIYANVDDGKMTVCESYSKPVHHVLDHILLTPKFKRIYEYLKILNLDYLSLDRQVMSLSGGERQRLYLLSKVSKNLTNSLLVIENISFGLSRTEIQSVSTLLTELVDKGNTLILIDQSNDFSKIANDNLKVIRL